MTTQQRRLDPGRQTDSLTVRETDRQTDRPTDRKTDRQTDRQTDRILLTGSKNRNSPNWMESQVTTQLVNRLDPSTQADRQTD